MVEHRTNSDDLSVAHIKNTFKNGIKIVVPV